MFGQQRISILQPTSTPSTPPRDDLGIMRKFPCDKATIGPTPISVLSWHTHPNSKTVMSRLDNETIARTQSTKREAQPKSSWNRRSNFRSGRSSRMKFLHRAASTASSSSSGSLRKHGIATWPSKWSRKATTKITISAVLPELPPERPGSPTRTLSSILDAPDSHDISAQYFSSSSAGQFAYEESEPGAAAVWNTTLEDSSGSEASVLPVNSDPHDLKRVEQQRWLAYYRLTGGEHQENGGVMDSLRADDFKQEAQVIFTEEELQHRALVLRKEGHLSIISERRSEYESAVYHSYNANADPKSQPDAENNASSENESFSKFLRTWTENAGSPPPIPKKSPSRRLRDLGALERNRVDGPVWTSLPSNQKQRIAPSEVARPDDDDNKLSRPSHEPEVIAPTPLSPALPHFHTIEEAEAYRQSQDSKRSSPSSHALAKCNDYPCGNEASQTESTKNIHSNTDHGSSSGSKSALKLLPDISRDSISKYNANTSNALTSAYTSSTSLSPTEKDRLRPEPLNLRSLARSSTRRSSSYAPSLLPPPPSPSLPLTPPQSKNGDGGGDGDGAVTAFNTNEQSEHETRSSEGDSVQLHFENPRPSTNTDGYPGLAKIRSNSPSSQSSKESTHEETGLRHRTTLHGQGRVEKKSQSQSQSLDPDVEERQAWYGREVRLRVERIRRALRTRSFYSGGSV
ncbi:hypothetical protein DV736_g2163, partial [Chaetothyriales sp. CBS 134916]